MTALRRVYWIHFFGRLLLHAPIEFVFDFERTIGVGALFFSQVFMQVGTLLFEVPFGVFADKYGHEKSVDLVI